MYVCTRGPGTWVEKHSQPRKHPRPRGRTRNKNKRKMTEYQRNENKSTCGYEDGFEELGEKHLRQIERGRSRGSKAKIACGPKWLLQISMTPSPPRPNLRWLIDSQHACTYVPGNWGIGLVYVVAWINQLDGRARTAELLQATETGEPSTPSELQSHKPSNPKKSHDTPPGRPPLQAPMSRNVLACSL